MQEDGEYSQYRPILEDEAFGLRDGAPLKSPTPTPFDRVVASVAPAVRKHFGVEFGDAAGALRLDDAFAIHYDATAHVDTRCHRHVDPNDVGPGAGRDGGPPRGRADRPPVCRGPRAAAPRPGPSA